MQVAMMVLGKKGDLQTGVTPDTNIVAFDNREKPFWKLIWWPCCYLLSISTPILTGREGARSTCHSE